MKKSLDLLEGNIFRSLLKLSLPLMGTAFVQMCYSLVDLMWLGRLSTGAVAAVGTCSFFVWIAQAITLIAHTGLSVGLSQAYGRNDHEEAQKVMISGFWVNLFFCFLLTFFYLTFRNKIIGYYNLEKEVENLTLIYFTIVSAGLIFTFLNPSFSAVFLARGNSITPFSISIIALLFNLLFDPILIFGFGPFPHMGIAGAAMATVFAQAIASSLYIFSGIKAKEIFTKVNYFKKIDIKYFTDHLRLGFPPSIQSTVQALCGVILTKYIATYGAVSIAVYSIGSQIESISWMTSDGFSAAFAAFFGQNYGAGNFDRIKEGRRASLIIINFVGIFSALLMFIFPYQLYQLFIPGDIDVILAGVVYLRIMALSEYFMPVEIGTTGMMNGLGLTNYPAVNAVVLNLARIPFALIFMPFLGVSGIWLSMSLSSILKGAFITIIFIYLRNVTKGFTINMEKYVSRK